MSIKIEDRRSGGGTERWRAGRKERREGKRREGRLMRQNETVKELDG